MASGLIVWSTKRATVGLVVVDDKIVDGPPYAWRWAVGMNARDFWRREHAKPWVTLYWIEHS